MTTRRTLLIDRLATLLLALTLIAGGLTALWWWSGQPIQGRSLPATSDTRVVADVVNAGWFGWAAALAGVVLALVGLRWIAAHLTRAQVKRLKLTGSSRSGRLDASGPRVAGAAADAFTDTVGVRAASGTIVRDRGQLVARLKATIDPDADLALLARRADKVSAQLAGALERDDLRCRIELTVARRSRDLPRAS